MKHRSQLAILWAVMAAQLLASVLYGLRLWSEWGTDFGVYFVGGMSITSDFGLYTGFFEHKGPLYYGFIHGLSEFVPYTEEGAAAVLILTCLVWFGSVNLAMRLMGAPLPTRVVVGLGAIAALHAQPSNASIALFGASFVVLSLALALRFGRSRSIWWLVASLMMSGFAVLTRVDAVAVVLLALLLAIFSTQTKRRHLGMVLLSLVVAAVGTLVVLVLLSRWLFFGLGDYWQQAVVFNASIYPEWYGSNSHFARIRSLGFLAESLLVTAFLAVWVIALTSLWSQIRPRVRMTALLLVVFLSAIFILTGSSKDYHLFVVFPGFLVSIGLVFGESRLSWSRDFMAATLLFAISSLVVLMTFAEQARCSFGGPGNCANRFADLADEVRMTGTSGHEFFMNQGWPFLLADRKATVAFTPMFPLGHNLGLATAKVLSDGKSAGDKVVWVSLGDIEAVSNTFGSDNLAQRFLTGRVPAGPSIAGFTPMSPVAN